MNYPGRASLDIRYDYAAANNRLSSVQMDYDALGMVTHLYTHDVRGNMTNGLAPGHQLRSQSFDLANRMVSATVGGQLERYAYDAHGRRTRIERSDGATIQMYGRDGQFLYERSPSGQGTRHVYLGGRLVASVAGSVTTYQHTDHLGSPTRRTNASGTLIGDVIFAPFGSIQWGSVPQGPGFTGHVQDAGTGLVYMQQRYYNPIAMRFVSVDPVTTSTTDGSNFNRYWYANNNPYRFIDPDGRLANFAAGFVVGFVLDASISRTTTGSINWGSAFRSGAAGSLTGGVGGALTKSATTGAISTRAAVAGSAATGAVVGGGSAVVESTINNSPITTAKVVTGIVVGGISAAIAARTSLPNSLTLMRNAPLNSPAGIGSHIANATEAVSGVGAKPGMIQGMAAQAAKIATEIVGKLTTDAASESVPQPSPEDK